MDLSHNWLLMAMLVPLLWAVASIIDICLVGNRIYRRPIDGVVVSCLLCLIPVVLVLLWTPETINSLFWTKDFSFYAVLAGAFYAIHLLFYFRILFRFNDVSGAETFLSLSVLIVPFLAWLLLGELLPLQFYFAFLLAALGVTLQSYPVIRKMGLTMFSDMAICVSAVSLSMVLQTKSLEYHNFSESILDFNVTCFFIAVVLIICNRQIRSRILFLFKKFPVLLATAELLCVIAIACSHRAIQKGPSVSFVALIECLLPIAIIGLSFILVTLNHYRNFLSTTILNNLLLQVQSMPSKIVAFGLLITSISVLSLG